MKTTTKGVLILSALFAAGAGIILSGRPQNVVLRHSMSDEAKMQLSMMRSDIQANREIMEAVSSLLLQAGTRESGVVDSKEFYQLMTDGLRRQQQRPLDFDRQSAEMADFVDPWDRPYKIRIKMGADRKAAVPPAVKVWSTGKDGLDREGGGDDIGVDIELLWSEKKSLRDEVLY